MRRRQELSPSGWHRKQRCSTTCPPRAPAGGLRVRVPAVAPSGLGERLTPLRVSVSGQSLQGEPVALERAGLTLPVLSASTFDALAEVELVARCLVEVAAADTPSRMRSAALQTAGRGSE